MVIYGDLMRLNGNIMEIYWDITIVVDHGRFISLPKIHIPTLPLSRASEDSYNIYIHVFLYRNLGIKLLYWKQVTIHDMVSHGVTTTMG